MLRAIAYLAIGLAVLPSLVAQDVVFPGSTVDGDYLRGQGQFLKGAAWYEIESAKARAIDAQTQILVEKYLHEIYYTYKRERSDRFRRKSAKSRASVEQAQREYDAREAKLRTAPTEADVASGDATNALLADLSNPANILASRSITEIPLPDGVSIPKIAFQFIPKPISGKDAKALSRCLVALGKLEKKDGWPACMRDDVLKNERQVYEEAYRHLIEKCLQGLLGPAVIADFDKAIASLRAAAARLPKDDRGFQSEAIRHVEDLKAAGEIFSAPSIDIAQEMIRDTRAHDAKTVGQLLAFMRKYRLMFAPCDRGSVGVADYLRLYELMGEQKKRLGLPMMPDLSSSPANGLLSEHSKLRGTWLLVTEVLNGRNLPQIPDIPYTMSFDGGNVVSRRAGEVSYTSIWEIDLHKLPNAVDRVVTTGNNSGQTACGIYELNGDVLRICWSQQDRPTEFESKPESNRQLLVYQRMKP